jgi:hypothetical protein
VQVAARYSHVDLDDREVHGGIENDVALAANWFLRALAAHLGQLRLRLRQEPGRRAHPPDALPDRVLIRDLPRALLDTCWIHPARDTL